MRILILSHSFNSLTQRLFLELQRKNYEISVEFDIHDDITFEAVAIFQPDLILAPYLRRAIPKKIWEKVPCFIVHPGVVGDRGSSSLDWAILGNEKNWGVTVFQAIEEMDAGPIWATREFPMRWAAKSSLYRQEVTDAAVEAALEALERFESKKYQPTNVHFNIRGCLRPTMKQSDRAINWEKDNSETVVRKIYASDGFPGVLDQIFDKDFYLFNAMSDKQCFKQKPGEVVAWGDRGILRTTVDGSVWIGHLKEKEKEKMKLEMKLKLPASFVLREELRYLPKLKSFDESSEEIFYEEAYEKSYGVGYLYFQFHNGAMSTEQCQKLRKIFCEVVQKDIRVLVLMGGEDFWSNGIHLHQIEAAESPADESWRNIEAMNDLVREILTADHLITISAIRGNAGAGGVFLALAADYVFARAGVVLNPHYKAMGNLFGSEYWTYVLPRRLKSEKEAFRITEERLPMDVMEAKKRGLIDEFFSLERGKFIIRIKQLAKEMASGSNWNLLVEEKKKKRIRDEQKNSLESYRTHEMEQMKLNFYGFDPSYHRARFNFVYRIPLSHTPRHLACYSLADKT